MKCQRVTAATLLLCALALGPATAADPWTNESFLHRVFLDDGTSLASFGEPARLGDRVVFSMPTTASAAEPHLHLVTIPANRVDWSRTNSYAESVRAAQYLSTRAESHYSMLTAEITQALNDVGLTTDSAKRLAIVERVRKTLADWPKTHFGYKQQEIENMVAILDETIADLRAAAGVERFDLSLVATRGDASADREPLLPPSTSREVIEQTLTAAALTELAAERVSLLSVALATIDREADKLPNEWRVGVRQSAETALADELRIDQHYNDLQARMLGLAATRAKAADVRGVERVVASVRARDKELGGRRPETVAALLAAVAVQLDSARQLRLERDRMALRWPVIQKYQTAFLDRLTRFEALKGALEDIKALSGSAPEALASIEQAASAIVQGMSALTPPDEFRSAHGLIVSAANLAASAAQIRREAALGGNLTRAWDASSAAAGSLMLGTRARAEIQTLLRLPLFQR
jgi:hypothetical protein